MTWAQRLKRVFGIDIEASAACGGAVRIIACIEDPEVIERILAHLDKKTTESPGWRTPWYHSAAISARKRTLHAGARVGEERAPASRSTESRGSGRADMSHDTRSHR